MQVANSSINVSSIAKKIAVRPPTFITVAQLILSVAMIIADISIFLFHSLIIYYSTSKTIKSNKTKDRRFPIICMAIGAAFIFLTLPYVVARLTLGYAPFWANLTLLLNSGMNSVVYFFPWKTWDVSTSEKCQSTYIPPIIEIIYRKPTVTNTDVNKSFTKNQAFI